MATIIAFSLFVGLVAGFFLGRNFKTQHQAASILEAGNPESDIIRQEAQKAVQERIERRKNRILDMVQEKGSITNDGVEDLFCISDRTAGRYLRELVSEGQLKKIGNTGRGVHYKTTS